MKKQLISFAIIALSASQTAKAQTLSSRTQSASRCASGPCMPNTTQNDRRATAAEYCSESRLVQYMNFASELRDYVSPIDYANYLLPIKKDAQVVINTLNIYGPYHARTSEAFMSLIGKINAAKPLFEDMINIEAFFEVISDIEYVTMSLERSLYN